MPISIRFVEEDTDKVTHIARPGQGRADGVPDYFGKAKTLCGITVDAVQCYPQDYVDVCRRCRRVVRATELKQASEVTGVVGR